jgi:CHAT domain-containing protein/Tfp pilus assembly protein PilF
MKVFSFLIISLLLFFPAESIPTVPSKVDSLSHESTGNQLIDLPWSEKEVAYNKKLFSGNSYLFHDATEENFRKFAPHSKIIHLATHAIINDDFPMYSRFLFSPSTTSLNDGLLQTYELYNMNLNSDLAVLSACNTGTGKLIRGEGIMSLARGFHYAGCANVVMSLWQVDDKSTSQIMNYFYKHLKHGVGISEALRLAKIEYLENADEVKSHPYYWAGFIHIGKNESIIFNKHIPPFIWIFGGCIFVIALVILFFNYRKHLVFKTNHSLMRCFFVLIFVLLFSNLLFVCFFCKQEKTTSQLTNKHLVSSTPNDYISRAEKLARQAYFDSSNYYFEKAAHRFLKEDRQEKYIFCLNGLGKNLIEKAEYDSARKLLLSVLKTKTENPDSNNLEFAKTHNHLATIYRKLGDPQEALLYYQKAFSLLPKKTQDGDSLTADIYKNIGITYYYLGNFDRVLQYNDSSLTIRKLTLDEHHLDFAQNHSVEGLIYSVRGDLEKAFSCYQKSLSIRTKVLRENHPDIAKSFLNMGVIFYHKGDYENALKYYQKSLKIKLENIGENNISIAGSYMNLGVVSDNTGDYENAKSYYLKALSIMNTIGAKNHILLGDIYMNLGISHKNLNNTEKALEYYKKSLNHFLTVANENHPRLAKLFLNLGIVCSIKKNHQQSLYYFKKSLSLGAYIFKNNSPHFAITHLNMALEYLRTKNYFQAKKYFETAVHTGEEIFGERHAIVSEAYQGLGQIYSQQQDYDKALLYFQKAIFAVSLNFENKNIYSNPTINNVSEKIRLLNALFSKARALENRFDFQTKDTSDLSWSIKTYELAIDLINRINSGYHSEITKLNFSDTTHAIFAHAVKAAIKTSVNTNEKKYKRQAFTFVEQSKANILRQALNERKINKFARVPDSLLERENKLKVNIAYYNNRLFEERNKKTDGDKNYQLVQDKLFSLKRSHEVLMNKLMLYYPNYYNLKYLAPTKSVRYLQNKLKETASTIIEYFWSDSTIFIFQISDKNFNVTQVKADSLLHRHLFDLRRGLMNRDDTLYASAAFELYLKIFKPIEKFIPNKTIIIFPDGVLGYIPFETLLTKEKEKTTAYKNAPFLNKRFQIRYGYSASILFDPSANETHRSQKNFVGFAPVVFR